MATKNLLIIANNYPNADNSYIADIFVKEQLKYIKGYFNEVFVISPVAYGIEYVRKTKYFNYQYDNVKVIFPKYLNFPLFYKYGRKIWIFLEVRAISSLIKKLNIKFDIIHAHFTWPSGVVAIHLKNEFRVPVIITEGSSLTLYKELGQRNPHYLSAYSKCDAIIRNNKKDIPLFINSGIDKNKIFYVEYGYDQQKYYPIPKEQARKYLGIPVEQKLILHISRLFKEKGQNYLIDAIYEILKERDDFICYIGGTGPERDTLMDQINMLGIQEHVKLLGFIPDEQMITWINACDFFILPSLSEGNPTVMFEVMGCGKPFIGTRVGGIPEIINNDNYGFVVEPGDTGDLANKILISLDKEWDKELILSYSDQFSCENTVKDIFQIYQQFI